MGSASNILSKEVVISKSLEFMKKNKRLPFLKEDVIKIQTKDEQGQTVDRPYKISRHIVGNFKSHDNFREFLFDNDFISPKTIADLHKISEKDVEKALNHSIKKPKIKIRKALDFFFNHDFYKELGNNSICETCTKKCKQLYWVELIGCSKYRKSKAKKRKNN